METNPIPALLAALQVVGLGQIAAYAPLVIAASAVLAAILPHPSADSPWVPARKLLDLLALNIGSAKNAQPASASNLTSASALVLMVISGLCLSACSASQFASGNQTVVSDLQAVNAVIAQDARLFCAVASPAGPLVVSVANAAGAPVVATGQAKATVDAACTAVNGIAVSPPPVGTSVPVLATSVPPKS